MTPRIRNRPWRTSSFSAGSIRPVTLAEIKQSKLFDDWALVRQGRLSTMAAPDKFRGVDAEEEPEGEDLTGAQHAH